VGNAHPPEIQIVPITPVRSIVFIKPIEIMPWALPTLLTIMLNSFLRFLGRTVYVLMLFLTIFTSPAFAAMDDDRFDGNIYVLYAGNGSIVPPRIGLADSFKDKKPAMLVFYLDDSKDCKRFAGIVSQAQSFYGRAANLIPVSVDSLNAAKYEKNEPGYYYSGKVPQTVIFDSSGKIVFNESGNSSFESIDIAFRKVFNRPDRPAGKKLEQRSLNEFNSELSD
jgi:thiol-disulfide isomerase/thioredoxin